MKWIEITSMHHHSERTHAMEIRGLGVIIRYAEDRPHEDDTPTSVAMVFVPGAKLIDQGPYVPVMVAKA